MQELDEIAATDTQRPVRTQRSADARL